MKKTPPPLGTFTAIGGDRNHAFMSDSHVTIRGISIGPVVQPVEGELSIALLVERPSFD